MTTKIPTAVDRRAFLQMSGALVVSFSAASILDAADVVQGPFDTRGSHVDPTQLDSWLAVGADGGVTAYTGKCEFGQGMYTAQIQLVAEELSVPVSRVKLIQCDTSICPDQGTTSGSQSTPTNFNERNLAQAAATAREALLRLASQRLGVPVDRLSASDGVVGVKGDTGKRVSYGELVGGKRFDVTVNAHAPRKAVADWKVMGTPVPRVDMTEMATGTFEFVHNVRVPGMLHGRVVRPASVGAAVASVDEASVRGMPGLVKVVVRKNFVGVVCEKQWQAIQAAAKLKVVWTAGPGLPAQHDFYDHLRKQPARDAAVVDSKDVDQKMTAASSVLKATYLHPYQMHGSMGTSCAVADVQGNKATVWSPTQSAYPTRSGVAAVLGIPPDNVRVIYVRGSGCYGINGADTVSYDAALLSHAVGKPVRIQLSRQDEMAWENYGFAYVIDQRAAVDRSGTIAAWDCESWSPSLGGRPGYDQPGNVVTGMLVGFEPAAPAPRAAGAPRGPLRNGSNAVPSYLAGCIDGSCNGAGTIKSERVVTHTIASPFFTGPLRSPARLQNTFAHECFLDEIAAHVKADPVEYRVRHLSDPRLREVVQAAAKAAKWQPRQSPQRTGSGRGIACVAYEGDNGYVAMVADVDVDQSSGRIRVRKLVVAQDCGPITNPDGMKNQIEGGALQGLSRALGEEVTWDERKVTSIDWRTYHSLPLGFDVPEVESVLINRNGVEASGAGETAITIVAAAVGNAVFDATGARIREVPFTPERIVAALRARS
ncbi:MAG: xanthine dehydrogenase family protein molybdopterin-binding subunit [Acidobacteria bacterium]|nr:MAG: xanthine dehydrogenase family protein molybdopterin-binding subunit [Acidobacteriota bacterium]PYQ81760.1 MAG: xanthine dehydrogenase family protein molybdopterin-binding subunit [Acidobacteriota bacterium]PYQ86313.1 MAG: xanthine dehydrogenase family protein molybdopterin-binding subunit [Acidobacteriota bacterium]PYR12495.1 MAG: xanthine dehydrogenase family protein molybdopterin-binding subunit [Acidobacteriota bacterium]